MAFGQKNKRRKQDAAVRTAAARGVLSTYGGPVLKFLVLVAVLGGLAWGGVEGWRWARSSPTFALKRTAYHGLSHATEAEVLRYTGLSAGQNLFELDLGAMERALATHPWVKRAELRRRLPDMVEVTVAEHVPVAMVSLGDLYLLDEEGEPFKRVRVGDALDLVLLSGVDREEYGKSPEPVQARMRAALDVVKAYAQSEAGKGRPVSEARLEGEDVVLVLAGAGEELRFGDGDTGQKLERLQRVQAELRRRGLVAETISLDHRTRPGWVTVKLQAPASERTAGAR
jgi:cell division protein FtsQ